jgi:hypothetical protein
MVRNSARENSTPHLGKLNSVNEYGATNFVLKLRAEWVILARRCCKSTVKRHLFFGFFPPAKRAKVAGLKHRFVFEKSRKITGFHQTSQHVREIVFQTSVAVSHAADPNPKPPGSRRIFPAMWSRSRPSPMRRWVQAKQTDAANEKPRARCPGLLNRRARMLLRT